MSKNTYTVLSRDRRADGSVYEILADDLDGFDAFFADAAGDALPGSTVDVADLRKVMRLRNDGYWEEFRAYGTQGGDSAAETARIESIADELVPDDYTAPDEGEGGETV